MEAYENERLTHPRSILVATNLSDLHRLMPFALQMAAETGTGLQLLHVLSAGEKLTADATGMPCYDREGALATAKNMLAPWCERARKMKVQCTVTLRESQSAAQEIISVACQTRSDGLILGTRSLGKLGRLLLGTVADQVMRSINLPVYTIGPEAHLAQVNSGRSAVVFATALVEGHEANAVLAGRLAASRRAKLIILHVLAVDAEKHGNGTGVLLSAAMSKLHHLAGTIAAGSLADVDVNIDIKIAHGKPGEEILAEATATKASLIVMGAADYSAFDSITRERTLCQVLAHAQCPVLSLHGPTAQRLRDQTEMVARAGI